MASASVSKGRRQSAARSAAGARGGFVTAARKQLRALSGDRLRA
jgi:hypothetical protein